MAELFSLIRKDLGHKDPGEAGLEIALGMLIEPDRTILRSESSKHNVALTPPAGR